MDPSLFGSGKRPPSNATSGSRPPPPPLPPALRPAAGQRLPGAAPAPGPQPARGGPPMPHTQALPLFPLRGAGAPWLSACLFSALGCSLGLPWPRLNKPGNEGITCQTLVKILDILEVESQGGFHFHHFGQSFSALRLTQAHFLHLSLFLDFWQFPPTHSSICGLINTCGFRTCPLFFLRFLFHIFTAEVIVGKPRCFDCCQWSQLLATIVANGTVTLW